MRKVIETSERQGNLFGIYLVDFLPKGHKVFLLEELLKGLNISKIRKRYKNTGGNSISYRSICYFIEKF